MISSMSHSGTFTHRRAVAVFPADAEAALGDVDVPPFEVAELPDPHPVCSRTRRADASGAASAR